MARQLLITSPITKKRPGLTRALFCCMVAGLLEVRTIYSEVPHAYISGERGQSLSSLEPDGLLGRGQGRAAVPTGASQRQKLIYWEVPMPPNATIS